MDNITEDIYKFQIHTKCKNKNKKNDINENNLGKKSKNYGIYKIESYSEKNHPEYNDNENFLFLNFTFNYNKNLYYFSFV